ncbi:DNA-binding transcriptional regulator, LysR family [Pseudomonas sp. NFACC02]|uniref:LysR family transcriptional regulator n=1 Tax=Pseudomonas sp. NFACC02 TaxID=1566250 RepID=UPI0008AEB4F2|nr:LysR family transcriptional regulator [Pseudomonas sp. NFACC02]SER73568.1 DNA-binding transcriptional regulator, LysR family [Pseudomonas sp. NFACC02]
MLEDLNDLQFFVLVVRHNGFTAAAKASGIEKTRLSRRIAVLESRLGVRLLHRSTRQISLTEAGLQFYAQCRVVVEGANGAFDSVANLQLEPTGLVRFSCPQVMAESYLSPILPAYLAAHPKVRLELDASDRAVNLVEEGFDLALRARSQIEDACGLVARRLGTARRVLVASPSFLARHGHPASLEALATLDTLCRPSEVQDGKGRWTLHNGTEQRQLIHTPRMLMDGLRMQLEAAVNGLGMALLPESIASLAIQRHQLQLASEVWTGAAHVVHLLYPTPRGMLPSVRSLIDYLSIHLPASIQERSIDV